MMTGYAIGQQKPQLRVTFDGKLCSPRRVINANGFACYTTLKFIGVLPEIVQEPSHPCQIHGTEKTGVSCSQLADIRQMFREQLPIRLTFSRG